MQTRLITTEPELLALQNSWNDLLRRNPEIDLPFYSWDWFHASWTHFGKPEGHSLFVVAVEDADRLLGVLPLVTGTRKSSGIGYRTLEFCNVGMNPRNTAYFDPACPQAVFAEMENALQSAKSAWDMLELENVEEATPLHDFLLQKDREFSSIRTRGFVAPFIQWGDSLENYYAGLAKGPRKDMRKHLKRFNELPVKEVRMYRSPGEIAEGLDRVFQVRARSWKGPFRSEDTVAFFREMTPILSRRDEISILVLLVDGVPIGSAYALAKNGVYYGNLRDYDKDYRNLAPGILLLHFQLEELARSGGVMFDFCGTSYDHKVKFSTGMRYHSTFQIFHNGWKSRFLYSAKTRWMPLLRKILGKPAPDDAISDEEVNRQNGHLAFPSPSGEPYL